MSINDENNTQNPEQTPTASETAAPATESVLFDDLTVFSNDQAPDLLLNPELLSAAPERADGAGNENIQASSSSNEVRDQLVLNGERRDDF